MGVTLHLRRDVCGGSPRHTREVTGYLAMTVRQFVVLSWCVLYVFFIFLKQSLGTNLEQIGLFVTQLLEQIKTILSECFRSNCYRQYVNIIYAWAYYVCSEPPTPEGKREVLCVN